LNIFQFAWIDLFCPRQLRCAVGERHNVAFNGAAAVPAIVVSPPNPGPAIAVSPPNPGQDKNSDDRFALLFGY
jgi:hypothetical protein